MSANNIEELLRKHRLVEDVVHNQNMPRRQLVEVMVHRKHLAEIQTLLARLPAGEIGRLFDALAPDDAELLWKQLAASRRQAVLWEVAEPLRARLAGSPEAAVSDSQLNAFELVEGRLRQRPITGRQDMDGITPMWVDLVNPTPAERAYVGERFGVRLPDPGEATDLEVSSRFQVEEDGDIHLHSNFLLDRDGDARSVPVLFILHAGVLFTVRNEELPVFRLQRRRTHAQPGYVTDCLDLLIDLYGADVEYCADALENIYAKLGEVGRQVLGATMSDGEAAATLAVIAEEEDINGRIRSNILDTQRALSFLMRGRVLSPGQQDDTRQILRDIESLNSHTAFLFDKINFLMDATIGFININQNQRVSQLTVLGMVFMPINILAGIGGMSEFSMMTEGIPWPIAYGGFVMGAGLIGWGTYRLLQYLEVRKAKDAGRKA
ncbi:magnesium and cobalt transport protein CorA [uncultured Zoogloea sp.]|uniref:magnesium and cobalt transport protein CorA n=1 Tax=uncultured Zoogloea sp. TaxID=160237 RepID=UPI002617AFCC|nr:magnesium and cobalt transport protein CorA [uncultured Zoogloea sp.]